MYGCRMAGYHRCMGVVWLIIDVWLGYRCMGVVWLGYRCMGVVWLGYRCMGVVWLGYRCMAGI